MNVAIVYCSQTGHTKKYVLRLAEELGVPAAPFASRKAADVETADVVVFLSWIHAGGIKEAGWLRKLMDAHGEKNYVMVAVGAYPIPDEVWPQSDVDAVLNRAFLALVIAYLRTL